MNERAPLLSSTRSDLEHICFVLFLSFLSLTASRVLLTSLTADVTQVRPRVQPDDEVVAAVLKQHKTVAFSRSCDDTRRFIVAAKFSLASNRKCNRQYRVSAVEPNH